MSRRLPVPSDRQRGVALITAILLVAIATVLAAKLSWDNKISMRRTEAVLMQEQARLFALGAEAVAIDVLFEDDNEFDAADEDWAQVLPPVTVGIGEIELGQMQGRLSDVQGRLNINNLVPDREAEPDEPSVEMFLRLFNTLGVEPAVLDAIIDWMDNDTVPRGRGAEDGTYTALTPGYRAANNYFVTISELRAVAGVDPEVYELLLPHITAIPPGVCGAAAGGPVPINLNFATAEVMASLSEDITPSQAAAWIEERGESGWESIAEIGNFPESVESYATLKSECLQLNVTVAVGTSVLTMYSLLDRSGDEGIVPVVRAYGLE
jgi:general secretion pathway protein K